MCAPSEPGRTLLAEHLEQAWKASIVIFVSEDWRFGHLSPRERAQATALARALPPGLVR